MLSQKAPAARNAKIRNEAHLQVRLNAEVDEQRRSRTFYEAIKDWNVALQEAAHQLPEDKTWPKFQVLGGSVGGATGPAAAGAFAFCLSALCFAFRRNWCLCRLCLLFELAKKILLQRFLG
jgi:hypothetical protein